MTNLLKMHFLSIYNNYRRVKKGVKVMQINSVGCNNQPNFGSIAQIKSIVYFDKKPVRFDSPTGKLLLTTLKDVFTGGADLAKIRTESSRIFPDYLKSVAKSVSEAVANAAAHGILLLDKGTQELLKDEAAIVRDGKDAYLVVGKNDVLALAGNTALS